MQARYICFEGTEGVGKTTQVGNLVQYLKEKGYKVLQTKEPGTPLSPLTMELRKIMLDVQYDKEMTSTARELVSQAIRSIHLEKIIIPALDKYDFIIQDRGVLSGLAYGNACGNDIEWLEDLAYEVSHPLLGDDRDLGTIYDEVIYLNGDATKGLQVAKNSKQEFEAGDAMEARGNAFIENAAANMREYSDWFNTKTVSVDGKTINQVFTEVLNVLKLG